MSVVSHYVDDVRRLQQRIAQLEQGLSDSAHQIVTLTAERDEARDAYMGLVGSVEAARKQALDEAEGICDEEIVRPRTRGGGGSTELRIKARIAALAFVPQS